MINSWLTNQRVWLLAGCFSLGLAFLLGYTSVWVDSKIIIGSIAAIILMIVIIRQPIIGVYLLCFFLPFERLGSIDLAGITIRPSQVIIILTALAWLINGLRKNTFQLQSQPLLWPILLFIGINCLGLINTPNLHRSLIVLIFTIFTITSALLLPQILHRPEQLRLALFCLLAGMTIVTLFGIYQFLGDLAGLSPQLTGLRAQYTKEILGFPRVQSTALEPLYFANYLLIPCSLITALWLSRSTLLKPWLALGLLTLGGLNIILTVSRGGYIAWAVTLALLGLIYLKRLLQPRMVVSLLLIIALIGFGSVRFLGLTEKIDVFTKHVVTLFDGASYVERVDTFALAYTIWQQHPLIGVGAGGFGPIASYHPLIMPADGYKIVNNEYLELLAETGLAGLGCIILVFVASIVRSVKSARRPTTQPWLSAVMIGLTVALVGILVQYNTFSILYIMHIWVTLGLLTAVQNVIQSHQTR